MGSLSVDIHRCHILVECTNLDTSKLYPTMNPQLYLMFDPKANSSLYWVAIKHTLIPFKIVSNV